MGETRRVPAIAAGMWAAAFTLLAVTGQRLSTTPLEGQWQVLPLDSLSAHPLRSVWYLHIQPPGWNLLIGVLARWSPLSLALSLQLVFLACGCLLAAFVASTLRAFGLSRTATLVITGLATLNGSVLLAAFRPQYELPVATLLAALVWLATRAPGPRSNRVLFLTAVTITVLVMTRALYHPVLVPIVLAVMWKLHARHLTRQVVLAAAAIPLVVVGSWALKNEVLFDRATLSSWSGMNLLRSVAPAVDADDLVALERDGTVSEVATAGYFLPLSDYAGGVAACEPSHHDPVLTRASRPTAGSSTDLVAITEVSNFNNECYLPVYDQARDDALAIIRAEPDRWLVARAWAANNWFEISSYETDSPLATAIAKSTYVVLGSVAHPGLPSSWDPFWAHTGSWSLVLVLATGAVLVLAAGRLRRLRDLTPTDAAWIVLGVIVAWTMAAGIGLELGEQVRFRTSIDPLVLAAAGAAALDWWGRRAQRRSPVALVSSTSGPRRQVLLSSAVIVLGIAMVQVRQGEPTRFIVDSATAMAQVEEARASVAAPPTTTPPALVSPTPVAPASQPVDATAPAPAPSAPPVAVETRPTCRHVVHLGDSNLALAAPQFRAAYADAGIENLIDTANGRGALVAKEGTPARDAIAGAKATTSDDGRCWIIALSSADAVQSSLTGTDPRPSIREIADAIDGEPTIWVPPVLTSATTEWNLLASTTYDIALGDVAAQRPNIVVVDWPSVALAHLDQFQNDGVHYTDLLYGMLVDTVMGQASTSWDIEP